MDFYGQNDKLRKRIVDIVIYNTIEIIFPNLLFNIDSKGIPIMTNIL